MLGVDHSRQRLVNPGTISGNGGPCLALPDLGLRIFISDALSTAGQISYIPSELVPHSTTSSIDYFSSICL